MNRDATTKSREFAIEKGGVVFTFALPEDELLWWLTDGEFKYTHIVQLGLVRNESLRAVQLVIGPVLVLVAWASKESR
jgi:hypothetical protein